MQSEDTRTPAPSSSENQNQRPTGWGRRDRDVRVMRRALRQGAQAHFIRMDWLRIRDNETCYLRGKLVSPDESSFDHVIPLSRGGNHTKPNLKLTHIRCNFLKGNKLLSELDLSIFDNARQH